MTTYTCPPHIKWVIDAQQTIVINEQNGTSTILSDVNATLWNWFTLNHPTHKLLAMITALDCQNPEHLLQSTLQKWKSAGLLMVKEA